MSDSWISWNPRIDEPSNPIPSSKLLLGQLGDRDREVLHQAREVAEAEVDDLGPGLLRHGEDVLGRLWAPHDAAPSPPTTDPQKGRGEERPFLYNGVNLRYGRPGGTRAGEIDVERDDAAGEQEVQAIGGVQIARTGAGHTGVAVLEGDAVCDRVDQHDAVVVALVVDRDQAVRERRAEARMVEHPRAGRRGVVSPNFPGRAESDWIAPGCATDKRRAVGSRLRIRRCVETVGPRCPIDLLFGA